MQTINGRDAVELLRRAVELKGRDYVYVDRDGVQAGLIDKPAECRYLHNDGKTITPGCIVGHVMKDLGVPDSVITPMEGEFVGNLLSTVTDKYRDALDMMPVYEFTAKARSAFGLAQTKQDFGMPWGEVLDFVEEYVSE